MNQTVRFSERWAPKVELNRGDCFTGRIASGGTNAGNVLADVGIKLKGMIRRLSLYESSLLSQHLFSKKIIYETTLLYDQGGVVAAYKRGEGRLQIGAPQAA